MEWERRGTGYDKKWGTVSEIYWRNLFKLGYKLNELLYPYLGAELRVQFQNPRIPYHNGFENSRFFAGTNLQLTNRQTLGFYYLFKKE
jgi:hypothetical protein